MEKTTVQLTTGKFLLLICDRKNATDHLINHLSKELSNQLTDSSAASPIVLDNLIRRELARSLGIPVQDQGFLDGEFKITSASRKLLQQEILTALASARERDCWFDLALAASGLVPPKEIIVALAKRKSYLTEIAVSLQSRSGAHEQPLHLRVMLEHPLSVLQCEIEFMDILIQALSSTSSSATHANEHVSCTVLLDAP